MKISDAAKRAAMEIDGTVNEATEDCITGSCYRAEECGGGYCVLAAERIQEAIDTETTKAFTMIELLVVICVIAILAALLFPVVLTARKHGKKTEVKALLVKVDSAIRNYKTDDGGYPFGGSIPASGLTTNCVAGGGLFTDDLLKPYLVDDLSESIISGSVILDGYKSGNYPDGAPLVYAYYNDNNSWPSQCNGPYSGYLMEFQLWSIGGDGEYMNLTENPTTTDADNVTVTAFK